MAGMENGLQHIVDYSNIDYPRLQALFIQYAMSIFGAIVILAVGWLLTQLLGRWTYAALSRVRGFDTTIAGFASNFVRYFLMVMVIVMVLGQFGVQTASIIAALGAAGLAIGLALQGTLQNIAAGIMLLILRPFRVGDYIETGSVSGIVQFIGIFTTEFKTPDGMYRVAPNSLLWNVQITNFSRMPTRRYDFTIGIGYEDDIERASQIMLDLLHDDKRVLEDPPAETFVNELADSAVTITLRYWTRSADFWPTSRDVTKNVKIAFDKAGINIPFPQVTYSGTLSTAQKAAE
jgi:small conductance mechanosensitive channel